MFDYIHHHPDWPAFHWDDRKLLGRLAELRHRQGRLLGRMEALGFELHAEALLRTLTEDSVRSSEIEGEFLDPAQVRSSIARRLGMDIGGLVPADRKVEGMVEMMLDATGNFATPLTRERLAFWQSGLFPADRRNLRIGADRDGPMQVVSGPIGRELVHFEAPASHRVEEEMERFLDFFEHGAGIDPVLKAGVAHLWFLTIHPFDDGNGRIARAITDLALARSERTSQRCYSLSAQIRADRERYYEVLEATQRGGLDITPWLDFFLDVFERALARAGENVAAVLRKARFWRRHAVASLNDRQRAMLDRLFGDFVGKLTSSKWATLAKTSQDTAARDIDELVKRGILVKEGGGRSTSYSLALDEPGS